MNESPALPNYINVFGSVLPSSDFWQTPPLITEAVAQYAKSCGCPALYDPCPPNPAQDGLNTPWGRHCYINPPYSKGMLSIWIKKGLAQYALPSEGTKSQVWLLNYSNSLTLKPLKQAASAVCDLYQRVKFVRPPELQLPGVIYRDSPKYNNVIYYLGKNPLTFAQHFRHLGDVFFRY
jgi:hypothetical protein